jgi:membrane protein YdbS with pleckstrin-like domain
MPSPTRVPEGASFAYDVGARSVDEQLRRTEALDTKAGLILASDGVLAGFVFSSDSLLRTAPRAVGVLVGVLILLSITMALLAFWNRRYESAPSPEQLVRLMAADEAWLKWRFLSNVLNALKTNRRKLDRKAALLTCALVSLIAAVWTLGGYFFSAQPVR